VCVPPGWDSGDGGICVPWVAEKGSVISDGRVETSKAHWNCVRSEDSQQQGCAVKNNWL